MVAGTGWIGIDGRKDRNGRDQVFDREWIGVGFGLRESKFLIISVSRNFVFIGED